MEMKIATLPFRELQEGEPVELWFNGRGNLVIRAYGEGGYAVIDLPLLEVIRWASTQIGVENAKIELRGRVGRRDRMA